MSEGGRAGGRAGGREGGREGGRMGGREGYFGEEEGELEAGEAVLVDVLEGLVHLPQPLPLHANAMLSASDRDW